MPLIKADHQLEQVSFQYDEAGNVVDVLIHVSYAIEDDTTGEEETRVRRIITVWDRLTATQKDRANLLGKTLNTLSEQM